MSIFGIGTDIVRIARFLPGSLSERVIVRVFSEGEIEYCRAQAKPEQHFAARFAAKEAAIKALSSGGVALTVTQVEVERTEPSGAPRLRLRPGGNRKGVPTMLPGLRLHVSLSHDGDHAIAVVVAEVP